MKLNDHGMTVIKKCDRRVSDLTGHPLAVAYEIIHVFSNADAPLKSVHNGGLNCPAAVADNRITGGGAAPGGKLKAAFPAKVTTWLAA